MAFDFSTPAPLKDAVAAISNKTPIGSALSSQQWEDEVPAALRRDAMFAARVKSAEAMSEMKKKLEQLAENIRADHGGFAMDRSKFIKEMQDLANSMGLRTKEQEKRGSTEDFGSERRLKLILEQQIGAAQAKAYYLQGQDPDLLDAWPAQELVRIRESKVKRDWKRRWTDAGGPPSDDGRLIAMKTDPVWTKLSRFERPYPPFDYNSGMGIEEIDREEAEARGLIKPGETIEPSVEREEAALKASLKALDPAAKASLKEAFGEQLDITGDEARWKASAPVTPSGAPKPKPTPKPKPKKEPAAEQPKEKPTTPVARVNKAPVSAALEVKAKGIKKRLEKTLEIIDRIHDDGALPKIPVDGRAQKGAMGEYEYRLPGIAQRIGVKSSSSHPELTLAHELGHFLDHQALGDQGRFASKSPALAEFHKAVESTDAVKRMRAKLTTVTNRKARLYLEYLLQTDELWARAYAQYVATKSGDEVLRKQLDQSVLMSQGTRQWRDEDFAPVLREIDKVLQSKGWIS